MDGMEGQEQTEFQGEMEKISLLFRFLRILLIKLSGKVNEIVKGSKRYFDVLNVDLTSTIQVITQIKMIC